MDFIAYRLQTESNIAKTLLLFISAYVLPCLTFCPIMKRKCDAHLSCTFHTLNQK